MSWEGGRQRCWWSGDATTVEEKGEPEPRRLWGTEKMVDGGWRAPVGRSRSWGSGAESMRGHQGIGFDHQEQLRKSP